MKPLYKKCGNLTGLALSVFLFGTSTQTIANTSDIDISTLVGSTPGSLSINQGAANYTVPITLPPGAGGMQPELSINYNSNSGNGQLGVGFSLGGLSNIHRCSKTIATDGVKGGISYNNNDRYCLDGQRLIVISGTDGESNSEYRTEIESFSRVKFNGSSWVVETKSGQTFEYGNTNDSKIEAQGKNVVRLWAVNKITDASNNTINYVYDENDTEGEYSLNRIDYANNSIQFTYEDRDDTHSAYQAGSKLRQSKRLNSISTYVNSSVIRTYNLEYQYHGTPARSRLRSIQQCVNNQCLPKTEFEWQTSNAGWSQDDNYTPQKAIVDNDGKDQGVRLLDVNGDGLVDMIYHRWINNYSQQKGAYLNTGNGWQSAPQYTPPFHIAADEHGDLGVRFQDVNGDGLVDMIYHRWINNYSQQKGAYLNTGNGWQPASQYTPPFRIAIDGQGDLGVRFQDINADGLTDVIDGFNNNKKTYLNTGNDWVENYNYQIPIQITKSNHKDAGTRFVDLNGDGLVDILKSRNNDREAYINQGTITKLQSITNGFGIQTSINYKPLTDNTVYTKDSGGTYPTINLQNVRQVVSSVVTDNSIGGQNTTTYKYGGAKVNLKGRGNLGFRWIETKDTQSNKLTRTEFNQNYPFIGQVSKTQEYIENNGSRQLLNQQTNTLRDTRGHNNKVHSAYLSQSIEHTYDFNSSNLLTTVTTTQSNIDNYGNVGNIVVTTTGNSQTFTKTTSNTYNNDVTNWHLGRLTKAVVTHHAPNTLNITRTSSFSYNNNGLLSTETIEPNSSKALTSTYKYDSFGNKTKATTSASGISSRSTTTTYSADGKFPTRTTNALGHSETKTFDAKTGNVLSLTGPNGLTTRWEYDALGRTTKETRVDDTNTTTTYNWAIDDSPNSIYKITTTSSGSSPKTTYFDAFNRKVREQHTGFDGRQVNSDTYYDNLGRLARASLPYFSDKQGYFVTTEHDAIGRLISTTKPADYGNTATESTAYNGLVTTSTNVLGHQKTITKNAIGKIIRIDEPEGAWLTHKHDSVGNLIQTNVGNVITTMSYDNRGNKIAMNDPDMGRWTYAYNALGELISQIDAKGQTSTMQYDKLGRMIRRTETEGTSTWNYDTQVNGIGKLAVITGTNGYRKQLSYDSLGRALSATLTSNGETLTSSNSYDEYSRLDVQTRPQNFQVENVYNQYGYLMAKRAPKDQISDYDWGHLQNLLEASLINAEQALTKANYYEQKVAKYTRQAKWYNWAADYLMSYSVQYTNIAQQLRASANQLTQNANRLQAQAKLYKQVADMYFVDMRRFIHLSNMDVAHNQARSYIDTKDTGVFYSYSYYDNSGMIGTSQKSGFSSCKNKQLCDMLIVLSKRIGDMLMRIAKQKQQQAAALLAEAQAKNNRAERYEWWASLLEHWSIEYYAKRATEYVAKTKQASAQAQYWNEVATNALKDDNRQHYQAMLNDTENVYFYRIKSRDAAGRLTGHINGNGLSTEQDYSPASGHLYTIKSGFSTTNEIRNLEYQYDLMDNVTQRSNHISGLSESFTYDSLDRLTQSNTQGSMHGVDYNYSTDYTYDINGNILNKSNVGDYNYNDAYSNRPHTPNSITGLNTDTSNQDQTYIYDANGNMTQNGDKRITWTSHNKPKRFSKGNDTTTFIYAPNRSRYQKVQTRANTNTRITTRYFGKVYEQIKQNTNTQHKHFVYLDGQLVAIHIKTNTTSNPDTTGTIPPPVPDKTRYLHYDNLGSIDTITDGQGNIVERMAYTAFGQRRQGDWRAADPLLPIIPALTNRGFTGHEHIDEMDFIHMNGRVYDPQIGRFLSADIYIQNPYNTQSYNRYSYVLNNPLKYTDPSGHFIFSAIAAIFSAVAATAAVVVQVVTAIVSTVWGVAQAVGGVIGQFIGGAIGATEATIAAISQGASIGFVSGGISGGSLESAFKGAVYGGASAGLAQYIGHGIGVNGMETGISKNIAHGFSQGATSQIMGGNFKDGFTGGFVGSAAGGMMGKGDNWSDIAGRTAISAAGGVAAELGGGKFSNGARSAAFVHLFNAENIGGNIKNALTPDSVAVPGWEGKALVLTVSYSPATLETNIQNPYNSNPVFSSHSSLSLFGFGLGMTQYSYDLGNSWTTPTYDFISNFGENSGGDFVYKTGIGFRRGRLDYQYDFEIPIIRSVH
ncbi:Rhs family protein [uncultured Candidatus Thioglobus sp.]|nr:Rhs family protein [uncultured Candidatus Thioglobus sp.]